MSGDRSEQSTNQTTKRDPYAPAKGVINNAIGQTESWLADPNSSQAYQGPRVAGLSGFTTDGMSQLTNSGQQSRGYFDSVLNGDYLQGNPYQNQLDDSIAASVMPRINNQFSAAGMNGSTLHQGTLTNEMTRALAAPRYQNYQLERGYQNSAAGDLTNLDQLQAQNYLTAGGIDQTQRQAELDAQRAQFEEDRTAGLRAVNEAMPTINVLGNMGGTTATQGTTSSSTQPGLASMIGGGAMMGAGLMSGGLTSGIVPGMAGLMSGGLSGFQQGYAGMHSPSYWPATTQRY